MDIYDSNQGDQEADLPQHQAHSVASEEVSTAASSSQVNANPQVNVVLGGQTAETPTLPSSQRTYAFYTIARGNPGSLSNEEPLLADSGAALHVCSYEFGTDYPLEPLPAGLWSLRLKNADGSYIDVYGTRYL